MDFCKREPIDGGRRHKCVKRLAVLGLVLLFAACGDPAVPIGEPPPSRPTTTGTAAEPPAIEALEQARSRWSAAGASTYRYLFQDDCGECDPTYSSPRQVVVWDGEPVDADASLTIEAMFQSIEHAAAAGQSVEVTYDPETGHPTEVWIDREARAYDGGVHWIITDLADGLPGETASLEQLLAAQARWDAKRPPAYSFRATILCDCPFAGSINTVVEEDRIVDWSTDVDAREGISPITIDMMFGDLAEMLGSTEGVVQDGIRFSGSAQFDEALGFPVWVGLNIEVLEDESELADLPTRLVFTVSEFTEVDPVMRHLDDAEAAQRRWEESGLVDYEYQLTVHNIEDGTFSDPFRVVVAGGRVESVTSATGQPVDQLDVPAYDISELFVLIQQWKQVGTNVHALFAETLGHPVLVTTWDDDRQQAEAWSIDGLTGR